MEKSAGPGIAVQEMLLGGQVTNYNGERREAAERSNTVSTTRFLAAADPAIK